MRLTIIKKNRLNDMLLPEKVTGSYWLTDSENGRKVNLLNVEAKDDSWELISNQECFVVDNNNLMVPFAILKNDAFYLVENSVKQEKYYVYASATVENSYREFGFDKNKVISVGSASSCDITYKLGGIPDKAFEITTDDNGHYINITDATASIYINRHRIMSKTLVEYGDIIFMFGLKMILLKRDGRDYFLVSNPNNLLEFDSNFVNVSSIPNEFNDDGVELSDDTLYADDSYFYRTPYFHKELKKFEVTIDAPPSKKEEDDQPYILTVGPMLTMSVTSVIRVFDVVDKITSGESTLKDSLTSLITSVTMLAGSLLWPLVTKAVSSKMDKKKEKKRQKLYLSYIGKKEKEIQAEMEVQRKSLVENYLSVTGCQNIIRAHNIRLWQRRVTDSDFLTLPIGIGNRPMDIEVQYPHEEFSLETDALLDSARELGKKERILKDVPITFSFKDNIVSGVVGEPIITKAFMDRLMLQMMAQYSYDELKIVAFTSSDTAGDYEYIKQIPHNFSNDKSIRYFGSNKDEYNEICHSLEKVWQERTNKDMLDTKKEKDTNTKDDPNNGVFNPHYVIITDAIKSVGQLDFIRNIMEKNENFGFSIIIVVDKVVSLPNECKNFINVSSDKCSIFSSVINVNSTEFKIDFSPVDQLYNCAREIANIPMDIKVSVQYNLPASLGFLEMYQVGKIEQLNSLERWKKNNPILTLSAPLGIGNNGEIVNLDLHEKYHGPHGLIAGTTGSGKSEFIVTYILSMAVNYSPDEVQFVLIDYKGGGLAMSFENEELGIKLPHIAGTITNLDKSEINRAISSIESELKRRQSVFNDAREKLKEGSMNIYKYQQFYRKGMVDEPMSHLLIVCDEFAELKQQQPEFMEQLISTSRIGRSLGVHLILATQKPAGVVNDQIWSNSKFKICLKVQDISDSQGVLKKPDAAYLKETGRFYLQVGYDAIYTLGQAAWAGTKYYPSDAIKKNIDTKVEYIDNIGRVVNYIDDDVSTVNVGENKGEELLNVVKYIYDISKDQPFVKRKLWLDNVKPVSYLADLVKHYKHVAKTLDYTIPFGEYDEPRKQEQGLLTIDIAKGNIAVMGQPGSGKEMFLSTLIWSSMIEHTPHEINHYIVDFGAETLKKFSKFPHVGEVVFQSELDRFVGVMQLVMDIMEERKKLFQEYNGSFEYYNSVADKKVPLVVVTINGYDIMCELMPQITETVNTLFRDAPRCGVIFICTGSSASSLKSRQLQYFNRVIVMQMQDESNYRGITNCRRGLMPGHYVGRGICKVTDDDDSYAEFQTASIVPPEQEQEYLKNIANQLSSYYKVKAKQLAVIPDDVTSDDLAKYITTLEDMPVGYNFYEKDVAKFNFASSKIHLIASKSLKEDMGFVYAMSALFMKVPNVKVRVLDMLDLFQKPLLDLKLFNEDYDSVVAALEKDVLTRTVSQDYAVNIIVGAAQFKKKLSKAGVEIWNNLFNNVANSNKCIFILIDNYDKLRQLKLEPWYNTINTSNGIWLSEGFSSQAIFTTDELSIEDKKLDYAQLGVLVKSGKYSMIKYVNDNEE